MAHRATTVTVEIQQDAEGWRVYTDHRRDGRSGGSFAAGLDPASAFAEATRFLRATLDEIAPTYPDPVPVESMPFMRESDDA